MNIISAVQAIRRRKNEIKRFAWRAGALALLAGSATPVFSATPRLPEFDGRLRLKFDAGWLFRQDEPPNATFVNAGWSWKKAPETSLDIEALPENFAGGDWKPFKLRDDVFEKKPGFAWFRVNLGARPAEPRLAIYLRQVDDNGVLFLNGRRLGAHHGWDDPVEFEVGNAWRPNGPNELAVLAQNTGNWGGIGGPVYLYQAAPQLTDRPAEAAPNFNDKGWRPVTLPHDYVIEGAPSPTEENNHGSLPRVPAWYRKTFTLPANYRGRALWLDFDGVYRNSTVYLNGRKLGHWSSGYAPFRYDISRLARYGGKNTLAVHVDPRKDEGWWYEGGGIYRHVWLNAADRLRVAPWGVFVQAQPRVNDPMKPFDEATADIKIQTELVNENGAARTGELASRLVDPSGASVAELTSGFRAEAGTTVTVTQTITLKTSKLWSIETPNLWRVETTVRSQGKAADRQSAAFGIRLAHFDKDQGFFLNGRPVKIKGTCNHQDFAGTGIAMPDGLHAWRVKKLKEMGSNAYRFSHNPMADALLDACDSQGMLVMDETRHLGDTESVKTGPGTTANDLSEFKTMIRRDRNHPSVIIWSLFNEEPMFGSAEGAKIYEAMREAGRKLDPTRPFSGASNGGFRGGIGLTEDLMGFNYNIHEYEPTRRALPNTPMYGSETGSAVSTRGVYETDAARGHVTSYDTLPGGSWANTAQDAWRAIAERPWMAGAFVWTGFDYRGEPTPTNWPAVSSQFGIMDLCGFPKDSYYYYQAWWGERPVVHIFPHWNWAGREGQPINVWVYSSAEKVELLLNGKSLGVKTMPRHEHVEWSVPYAPGALEARAYQGLGVAATDRVETTGEPASLSLKPGRLAVLADGADVIPVEAQVLDAQGRVVPTADNMVQFSVSGPGRIAGVGNGDPASHEPDKASRRAAFNGRCMALAGAATRPGKLILTATAPGLNPAGVELTAVEALPSY